MSEFLGGNLNSRPLTADETKALETWLSDRKTWVKQLSEAAVTREIQNAFPDVDEACGEGQLKKAILAWAGSNSITFPKKSKPLHPADADFSGFGDIAKTTAKLVSNGFQISPGETQIAITKSGVVLRPFLGTVANPGLHYKYGKDIKADIHTANKDVYSAAYDPGKKTATLGYGYSPGNFSVSGAVSHNFDKSKTSLQLNGQYKKVFVNMAVSSSAYSLSITFPKKKAQKLSQREIAGTVAQLEEAGNKIYDAFLEKDVFDDPFAFYNAIEKDVSKMQKGAKDIQGLMEYYGKDRDKVKVSGSLDFKAGDFDMPSYGSPDGIATPVKGGFFVGGTLTITF